MPIRCGFGVSNPTHHIALSDRNGKKIGLILCDPNGRERPQFVVNPVERTALKTTSGSSGYDSMDYPYNMIVQDDWEGGRASLDFERDSTRFYDSYRARTGKANKAYHGPQEQYTGGYRSQDYNMPGNVVFHALTDAGRSVAKRFQASASYTAAQVGLLIRRTKETPEDLTIAIYSDNAGSIDTELASITVASTRLADVLSEWLNETISEALVATTYYWMVVIGSADDDSDHHWEIGVRHSTVTTYVGATVGGADWAAAGFDLYFLLTDADASKTVRFFEYKSQQYMIVSGTSGAPQLYMNGERGAADSNAGELTKLKDATKSWTTNAMVGWVCYISGGPGWGEHRVVVSNAGTEAVMDSAWITEHTTATQYVFVAADTWQEITGHGLTAPVTDVLVSTTGVVYFCQGDLVNIRRHREYNNAGTWTSEWADDATNKATFMVYKPQTQRIVIANNTNSSGVAVTTVTTDDAAPPAWGTDITFPAAVTVGETFYRINGLEVYPDSSGNEAVSVYKQDIKWVVPASGNPYPVNLAEMRAMRSEKNGRAHLVHNVYEFFSLGNGLTRYYNGQFDEVGPNSGEGLPSERQGPVIALVGYPGRYFEIIDGGSTGYSSLLANESGLHEHYRAPKGQRLTAAGFQSIPGSTSDRLWLYQGNEVIWLPFPSDTTNELDDASYLYTHESAIVFSRMHAGMFDIQKIVRYIKLQTENLSSGVCWVEMDYRLNEEADWTTIDELFDESPTQKIDLISQYGLAAKRLQFRLRTYTTDATQTPVILALIVEAVLRTGVKNQYPISFRVMDNEATLTFGRREPNEAENGSAVAIIHQLQDWADDSSDSMLKLNSIEPLWDEKMVFLNPITIQKVTVNQQEGERFTPYSVYVCTSSLQEA